jgi:hypothetical protein
MTFEDDVHDTRLNQKNKRNEAPKENSVGM